jgi:hypothetical protein
MTKKSNKSLMQVCNSGGQVVVDFKGYIKRYQYVLSSAGYGQFLNASRSLTDDGQ